MSAKISKASQKSQKVVKANKGQKSTPKAAKAHKASQPAPKATEKAQQPTPANKATAPESAYRENGSYHLIVKALRSLGANKFHAAQKMIDAYCELCPADVLKAFKAKEGRNEETHKKWSDRLIVNALVTERKDYGAALRTLGWETRHEKGDDGYSFGLFRLN